MKILKLTSLAFISALIAVAALFIPKTAEAQGGGAEKRTLPSVSLCSSESVTIVDGGKSDYVIIFSSDANQLDASMASELRSRFRALGATVAAKSDAASPSEREILLGDTNRAVTGELKAEISAYERGAGDEMLVWGFMEKDGKLAYAANSTRAFERGAADFYALIGNDAFTVERGLCVIRAITVEQYEKELVEKEEAERQKLIDELIQRNSKFKQEDFGGDAKKMGYSPFSPPMAYPAKDVHPRLLLGEGDLDELRDFIYSEENAVLREKLFSMANDKECIEGFGKYYKNGVLFRYSEVVLATLETKALAYLITGDELYGYEAIISAKNMLLTLVYPSVLHIDTYHGASHTMTSVALVYDWCYDLLTDADKAQITAGVSNLMCPQLEYNLFLKSKPEISGVSGHGTGPQLLRDYITVSLAFFDEMPDWWEYVGGLFYEDFVPVIDVCYEGGWGSQGTGYGTSKYYLYTWAAYVIKTSVGEIPYENTDGARKSAHFWLSHVFGEDRFFQTGDTTANSDGVLAEWFFLFPAAALYADAELAYFAHSMTDGYESYFYNFSHAVTPALMAVFASAFPDFSGNSRESYNTLQYFSSPAGQLTARSSWDEDAAVVLMKIGEMTMANHDNFDHGTFQIYYKGLLATSSGSYDKYVSYSHKYYRQSTVAHNGLLIFNPAMSDSTAETNGSVITNAARYYYSGSQIRLDEVTNFESWTSGKYTVGDVTGVSCGYSLQNGAPEYAYVAGDITAAYDSMTVNYVGRRMLTVFTPDEEVPMLFFTFDSIESDDASFRKSFLLHTVNEPNIDDQKLTAEIKEGGGRLVMHSVSGAQKLVKIGGAGYAYWINNSDYVNEDGTPSGKNCIDAYTTSDRAEEIWGRIELSAIGSARTDMLTAMYTTDAEAEITLDVSGFSSNDVEGAALMNVFAVFVKNTEREYRKIEFTTSGVGLYTYYVSGIECGSWRVTVDGVPVANVYASNESGFVSFVAPAGAVEMTPGSDVIGENGGRIVYETGGAPLPQNAPTTYRNDAPCDLPNNLTRGNDIFVGWFTSPTFEVATRVTKTPTEASGTFRIYACWLSELFHEDYSKSNVDISEKQGAVGGITYNASSKAGASFKTGTDESGRFLTWTVGESDPHLHYINAAKNLSTSAAVDKCVTYTISLSPSGDAPVPSSDFRIISKKDVSGNDVPSKRIGIFRIAEGTGEVFIGDTNTKIATLSKDAITTLRLVLDFESGKILYYDSDENLYAYTSFTVPSGVGTTSTAEWMKCFDTYVFYWYAHSNLEDAAMRIYSIKAESGNRIMRAAADSNKIAYVAGGGTLPKDAPKAYLKDEPTPLPTPVRENSKFYGWYTDEEFSPESRVTEVPIGTEGVYTVYAKWGDIYVDARYNESSLNVENSNKWLDGITYKASGNEGASFVSRADENGDAYVLWTKGKTDPFLHSQNETNNFSTSHDSAFSYTISLSAIEDKTPIATNMRLISKINTDGDAANANLFVFKTDTSGNITLGDGEEIIASLSDEVITTLRIAVDFGNERIRAYSAGGEILAEYKITPPDVTGALNAVEWQQLFTAYLLYWYAGGGDEESAIAIYRIVISEGNIFE